MRIRNTIFLCFILCVTSNVVAQGLFDAVRYSDRTLYGSARYMSMGGAFCAIGGDASAIKDNPAGLSLFEATELALTVMIAPTQSISYWNSLESNMGFYYRANNVTAIFAIPTNKERGYLNSSFSISYNKLHNFGNKYTICGRNVYSITDYMAGFANGLSVDEMSYYKKNASSMALMGYATKLIYPVEGEDNVWASYLPVDEAPYSSMVINEKGYVDEYSIAYSGNVSDIFYFGVSIAVQALEYVMKSEYYEYDSWSKTVLQRNNFHTNGIGVNTSVGFMVNAMPNLRLGASFQIPTFFTLFDTYNSGLYAYKSETRKTSVNESEILNVTYKFSSPLRLQVGAAFVSKDFLNVSVEYNYYGYRNSMSINQRGDDVYQGVSFNLTNSEINSYAKNVHIAKFGAEYFIKSSWPIRLGFAYTSPAIKSDAGKTYLKNSTRTDAFYFTDYGKLYAGIGFGYWMNNFKIDFAYQYNYHLQQYTPFQYNAENYDFYSQKALLPVYGARESENIEIGRAHV